MSRDKSFPCCTADCPNPCENAAEGHQIACNGPVCEARDRFMLWANGYVVVPRHLLDELLAASDDMLTNVRNVPVPVVPLILARAAVVEAVGPTREDTK